MWAESLEPRVNAKVGCARCLYNWVAMPPLEPRVPDSDLEGDPRWQLALRVRSSPQLQKAPRLQALLLYVCECALRSPGRHIGEEQIGVAVFGRAAGYDTGVDPIVRVQVSQLRRKLEHHFLADGSAEPWVIDLPKGSYLPRFTPRAAAEAAVAEPAVVTPPRSRPRGLTWAALAILALLCAWLAVENARLRNVSEASAAVAPFWRQFGANGVPTQVVLSDTGLALLVEALGRPIPLAEYRSASYPWTLAGADGLDPKTRVLLQQASTKSLTSSPDATAAAAIAAVLRTGQAGPVTIGSARDVVLDLDRKENLVLFGHPRSNPWLELFDASLAFRYRFDEARKLALIDNLAPAAGEPATYTVQWKSKGYCVVAYLPKPRGEGNSLLVFGTESISVGAGGRWVTDAAAMAAFRERLGIARDGRMPHFQALLETERAGPIATGVRLLAHRAAAAGISEGR